MIKKLIATLGTVAAVAAALLTTSPAADAKANSVVATYKLAPGYYTLAVASDAIWALQADEYHNAQLYRINPYSHGMKLVTTLPFPAGGITVAYGSEWVTDYFGSAVWRLDPSGRVQAEIGVGLQPQWLHAAFGSLWVSNHHGASLSRIDPASNTVIDTVQAGAPGTFRSGPQDLTDDGVKLYAVSSNLPFLQWVDPTTDAVTTSTQSSDDQFCGPITAVAGYIWSTDGCSGATYRLRTDGSVEQVIPSTGIPLSNAVLNGKLWIGDDTVGDPRTGQGGDDAVLAQRDPVTGALLRTVTIGGDASDLVSGFGDLWVFDANADTIRRVAV